MKYTKFCKNCGAGIKAGREDRVFCSDKCGAAYHRSGTPDDAHEGKVPGQNHEQKERKYGQKCQYCGDRFSYNDYGARGGMREPLYCSNNHRQAAYRCRKAGKRTPYEESVDGETGGASGARPFGKREDKQQQQQKADQQQQQDRPGETRKNSSNTWEDVLGVSYGSGWDTIEAAWRDLIGKCHPDRNRDNVEWATQRTQDINQAYQALKKQHGRARKQTRV